MFRYTIPAGIERIVSNQRHSAIANSFGSMLTGFGFPIQYQLKPQQSNPVQRLFKLWTFANNQ